MLDGGPLEQTAHPAWLPPDTGTQLATGVNPLVCSGIDKLKVGQTVVLLVVVPVMDPEAGGHKTVLPLPRDDVRHLLAAIGVNADVSLGGDASCSGCSAHGFSVA